VTINIRGRLLSNDVGMIVIWSLKSELVRRRKAQGLKPIEDPNDIPDPNEQADYVSVS